MELLHARCAGLDVHKDTIVACVRIADGKQVIREVRTFGTVTQELLHLSDWLEQQGCTCVAMEATGIYWKPIWHVLDEHFEVLLANAAHIKNVPGRKTDVNDATWIADLAAHGLIRGSFVPPEPIQELRDLTRTRKQLAREIVQHTNRLQKTLESANLKLTGLITDVLGQGGRAIVEAVIGGETDPSKLAALAPRVHATKSQLAAALQGRVMEHHRFMLKLHLTQIDALRGAIAEIEARLNHSLVSFRDSIGHLITIPGVSETLAWVIVSEIGTDMSRFQTPEHLKSWACLCPRNDESAGKRRSTRIRQGCSWLKNGLIQAAWSVSRMKEGHLSEQFRRLRVRRGAKKAAVAVAASILTTAFVLLRDGVDFKDSSGAKFSPKDKQKSAKRLLKRLEELGVKVQVLPC